MKANYLLIIFIVLIAAGCVDNSGSLGLSMLPDSDGMKVNTKNFMVKTKSVLSGPVYAKTSTGYIGKFSDNEFGFGSYEGSFLTELNCIDDLKFPKVYDPVHNKNRFNMVVSLDSAYLYARLSVLYSTIFGDSLNPMEFGVYQLGEQLKNNHYTNIDVNSFLLDSKNPLAKRMFTSTDLSDSTRNQSGYTKAVVFELPKELGKQIISTNWSHPEYFANSDAFIKNVFKGVYIKTEAGDGTVIYADQVVLDIVYRYYVTDSIGGIIRTYDDSTDSIGADYQTFASTKEVIQSNRIDISKEIEKKVEDKDCTYLKSPAGIFTQAILPIDEIYAGLNMETDTLNSVKLTFTGYHHETTNAFSMNAPQSVLLIRSSEVKDFFEKNLLPDYKSSYITTYSNNKYVFSNIGRLVVTLIDEMQKDKEEKGSAWDEAAWLEANAISIIPISINTVSINNTPTIANIQHDLKPAFVKLKGGENDLIDIQVIYTHFNK